MRGFVVAVAQSLFSSSIQLSVWQWRGRGALGQGASPSTARPMAMKERRNEEIANFEHSDRKQRDNREKTTRRGERSIRQGRKMNSEKECRQTGLATRDVMPTTG